MRSTSSKTSRGVRGQTIVLGCVALLVLATTMMASYSLANALHQKIALQSHTDAQAYSLAIVEARSLNITSHYNRAIAAGLVAQMSLHSWMAIATADVSQLWSGSLVYAAYAVWEAIFMVGCIPPWLWSHCWCVAADVAHSLVFASHARDWEKKLDNIEGDFNDAVTALTTMVTLTSTKQRLLIGNVFASLANRVLTRLGDNAPKANFATAAMALNGVEFACSMEGSTATDFLCINGAPAYRAKASTDIRSKVMQQAANAARPNFDYDRSGALLLASTNFDVAKHQAIKDAQDDWKLILFSHGTWINIPSGLSDYGHVGSKSIGGSASENPSIQNAKNIAAGARPGMVGFIPGTMYHNYLPVMIPYGGAVQSDSNGGKHTIYKLFGDRSIGNTKHDKFKGVEQNDPCTLANCFVNYRVQTDPDKDYGQPSVYGAATQSLRVYDTNGAGKTAGNNNDKRQTSDDAPWELSSKKGGYSIDYGMATKADVSWVPNGDGYAVSKAKVYFHQLGDWQVPPNTFDPFWRAKLHFFKDRTELGIALTAVGDPGSILLGAPVEGQ
jgi:hypothetical protein